MIRIKIYILSAYFIASISVVVLLYWFSDRQRNNPNGFIRQLPSHKIVGIDLKDLKYNSWYLAGSSGAKIYFGNQVSPGRLLEIDSALKDSNEVVMKGVGKITIYQGTYLQIDSPCFYLMDGIKPEISSGDLKTFNINTQILSLHFTGGVHLTKSSFALRSVYNGLGNKLIKQGIIPDSLKATSLLEKQVDGMFCTDGEMVKIPRSSKMIYVYYYRNQFLCADSNLNLLYKGKTIDTISHAQIKVAKVKSSGQITMAAPPLYVNKRACANEKYLFVQSALRANNETEYMIKNVSMVDVYAIKDGKYQFSFYLPDFRGSKVRDFKVYGQSLYALYDHYLYKYQLNF